VGKPSHLTLLESRITENDRTNRFDDYNILISEL